ncbi:hypothetical protein SK128_018690, partial [Halocaridina rubra]
MYSPSQPDGDQVVVCSPPQPKEQTIIFRPFQAQGVRTVALRQYQEEVERAATHTSSFQTEEPQTSASTSEAQPERSGSTIVTWRPHETINTSSSSIQTTLAAPIVQIISQPSSPEHQPSSVEIELDVDLLKTWPPHHSFNCIPPCGEWISIDVELLSAESTVIAIKVAAFERLCDDKVDNSQ